MAIGARCGVGAARTLPMSAQKEQGVQPRASRQLEAGLADAVPLAQWSEIMPLVVASFPLKLRALLPSTSTVNGIRGRFFSPIAFA
jgi:hypothetical protein